MGPTVYLAEAGVTDPASFEGYTWYDGPPISSRRLDFSADELRLTRFGVAAAHAAEQAGAMEHPRDGSSAQDWLNAWLEELVNDDAAVRNGPARALAAACLRRGHRVEQEATTAAAITRAVSRDKGSADRSSLSHDPRSAPHYFRT